MKYLLLIFLLILSLFIFLCYKIISPSPFPSKYLDGSALNWHFFTKDKEIIRIFIKPNFLVKSMHFSGKGEEIKLVEIQSFIPFFIFNFYKLKDFKLEKTSYGIGFIKGNFEEKDLILKENLSFGWFKTNPEINFNLIYKERFFFKSFISKGAISKKFSLPKDLDIGIISNNSPHFNLFFPSFDYIEAKIKGTKGYLKVKQKGKENFLQFGEGDFEKEGEFFGSLYIKYKENKILKSFFQNPILNNLKEFEMECKGEKEGEICEGYFILKNNFNSLNFF